MASYSAQYPIAFHVIPLHALKGVWACRALLSKADGTQPRYTTAGVDRALGVERYIHFYLSDAATRLFQLPILQAQLGPSIRPPFPHGVLELSTAALTDAESVICNWNLAVSRPGTDDVKGGNWARGTNADRIASVWRAFRSSNPPLSRARGFFNAPHLVPTLIGPQIAPNLGLLRKAPRGMPELLLPSPVDLRRCSRLLLFSRRDVSTVQLLGPAPLPMAEYRYPGYDGDLVPPAIRRRIEAYFTAPRRTDPPELDFDHVRPVA